MIEARGFRDAFAAIEQAGVTIVGVSRDTPESHRRFREANDLPFPLASDPEGGIARSYGVERRRLRFLRNRRATFVIDRSGSIRGVFQHEIAIRRHVEDVLRVLAELGEGEKESV